ncbi:extensin [Cajanus cajan]|nr:extensin [Cajanus cajan]
MAKNNKYASINFNHIYEKTTSTNTSHPHKNPSSSSSSASYSAVSAPNKPHGRILVLTRPTPKPKPITPPTPQPQPPPPNPVQARPAPGSDAISLRPLGRTGTTSPLSSLPVPINPDKDLPSPQPKTNKFVPPHLRPGFVPREEAPGPESLRPNGRPKSGGGHERMRRPVASDAPGIMGRGSRPSSSG